MLTWRVERSIYQRAVQLTVGCMKKTAVPVNRLASQDRAENARSQTSHSTLLVCEEVDVTELEALRQQLNRSGANNAANWSLLPFLMRAVVLAAQDFPK